MNPVKKINLTTGFLPILALLIMASCSSSQQSGINQDEFLIISTLPDPDGTPVEVVFLKGPSFNYPLMAIWVEDLDSNYIETLYVAESIGKGTFDRAKPSGAQWEPGEARRPAALPYWGHKRGIQAADGLYLPTPKDPVADAITGPTPTGNFILKSRLPRNTNEPYRILLEINQSWDWNEYWTNHKFPEDMEYKTSSQPALVYEAIIDPDNRQNEYTMIPIGHSHYSGKDGNLYPDVETLTTALKICHSVKIRFPDR